MITIRLPPNYGSVSKLSGNRRKPYIVRVTDGYYENGRAKQKIIGYAENRRAGLKLLAEYHRNPAAVTSAMTFEDLYEALVKSKEGTVKVNSLRAYRAAFNDAKVLHKKKVTEIKTHHLQAIIDAKDASKATKNAMRVTYSMMFDIALQNDLVDKNYAKFLKTGKTVKSKKLTFSEDEIDLLWRHSGEKHVDATLILIYTGMRITEFLELKTENIHLDEQYMIGGIKSDAGTDRTIALADRIMPLMRRYYNPSAKTLFPNRDGNVMSYFSFHRKWKPKMEELGLGTHTLHECRHTAVSRMYKAGVQMGTIQKQVGHSGDSVTEEVYLHVDVQQLLDAVNSVR